MKKLILVVLLALAPLSWGKITLMPFLASSTQVYLERALMLADEVGNSEAEEFFGRQLLVEKERQKTMKELGEEISKAKREGNEKAAQKLAQQYLDEYYRQKSLSKVDASAPKPQKISPELGGSLFIILLIGFIVFLNRRIIFGAGDAAGANPQNLAKNAKTNTGSVSAPQNAAAMQDLDYVEKRLQVDPYEKAMKELESDEVDKAVWAQAFSQSENNDATKRLYVKLRAEKLQGESPNGLVSNLDFESKKPFQLFSLRGFAYIIAIIPPASLIGAWLINSANDLPTSFLEVASGQAWLAFILWPFAIGYVVWSRNQ